MLIQIVQLTFSTCVLTPGLFDYEYNNKVFLKMHDIRFTVHDSYMLLPHTSAYSPSFTQDVSWGCWVIGPGSQLVARQLWHDITQDVMPKLLCEHCGQNSPAEFLQTKPDLVSCLCGIVMLRQERGHPTVATTFQNSRLKYACIQQVVHPWLKMKAWASPPHSDEWCFFVSKTFQTLKWNKQPK